MDAEFLFSLATMPALYGWIPVVPHVVLISLPTAPEVRIHLVLRIAVRRLQLHGSA